MTMPIHPMGSAAWWQGIAQQGTPVVAETKNGCAGVTFLWRDPEGDEKHSSTRKVWLNITGITDHHRGILPPSLERVTGTDVWQINLSLSECWRGSYSLMPDSATETPEQPLTMNVLRNWWKHKFLLTQRDVFNPQGSWKSARGHWVSPLHMPAAPAQPEWQQSTLPEESPSEQLRYCRWKSDVLGNSRDVGILCTGNKNPAQRPLIILLDGMFWAKIQPLSAPLWAMTLREEIPEAVYLFIDSVSNKLRSQELPCYPAFWEAIQQELLPQLQQELAFSQEAAKTVVIGQSFGGLAALYAGVNWPQRFGCVLSQSGSFWWPHRYSEPDQPPGILIQQIEQGLAGNPSLRIGIDAGLHEKIILQANRQLYPLLIKAGQTVRYREIDGGHDALCWRGGITDGLKWLWSDSVKGK